MLKSTKVGGFFGRSRLSASYFRDRSLWIRSKSPKSRSDPPFGWVSNEIFGVFGLRAGGLATSWGRKAHEIDLGRPKSGKSTKIGGPNRKSPSRDRDALSDVGIRDFGPLKMLKSRLQKRPEEHLQMNGKPVVVVLKAPQLGIRSLMDPLRLPKSRFLCWN